MSNSEKLAEAPRDGRQGPVAFKDAADVDAMPVRHPTEHDSVVSDMPACLTYIRQMRWYKGFWVIESWARGLVAMERSFVARPGDVVLASLPKAGTTWLKALTFATMARCAWPPSRQDHPLRRLNPHDCVPFVEDLFSDGREALFDVLPSPRLLSTHLPLSMLPSSIAGSEGCKIVYICRNEKDRMVSLWHFMKRIQPDVSFSEVYESVCEGTSLCAPVWDHILEYWKASKTEPSKVLFLVYENMLQDPCNVIWKLSQFVGQPFSDAEDEAGVVSEIVNLCSLENLRNQKANKEGYQGVVARFSHDSFFRKGVTGDWVNHMTPEMGERIDTILKEKLDGSVLAI